MIPIISNPTYNSIPFIGNSWSNTDGGRSGTAYSNGT